MQAIREQEQKHKLKGEMRESCLRGSVMRPGIEQTHEVKTFWRNEQVDEDVLCRWGVCLSGAARASLEAGQRKAGLAVGTDLF